MTSGNETGIPNWQAPFVGKDSRITQAWRQFLVTLWTRTGSATGNGSFFSGDLKLSASVNVPQGWLPCDGAAVSRTTFSALFAAIDTRWGIGDGTTTFNVPDLRLKFPYGADGSTVNVGDTGGADHINPSVAQLPAHTHVVTDPGHVHAITDPGHSHGISDPGHHHTAVDGSGATAMAGVDVPTPASADTGDAFTGVSVDSAPTGVTVQSHTTGISLANTGTGADIPILPPYAGVLYLIKT